MRDLASIQDRFTAQVSRPGSTSPRDRSHRAAARQARRAAARIGYAGQFARVALALAIQSTEGEPASPWRFNTSKTA